MKKRILALILSLTMIFTMSAVKLSAMAQTTDPTITLESIEAESGEEVAIKVLIGNNPGIWGMDLKVSYDKSALTLTSVDNGEFYQASEWTKGNLSADVYILSYEASGFDNITTRSGTLATLNFKVSDTAVAGDYAVTASYNAGDIINVSFDDINFNITNGKVTIKAKPVSVTGVSLNKETISLNTGASETLIATVSPDNATNKTVTWKSSDTTVAIVDNNGKVTAIKKGTATITVTTEDGRFTDTCAVSVACSHANTTVHPANTSTCLVQGNDEYTTCDDCGIVVSGSDAKLPLVAHKGGTATCKEKAICTVCSEPHGNYASHKLTNHARNESDHNNAGNIEYWTCDVCSKYFSDANGANEITQADTVIAKIPHSHATTYSYSDTQHWRECGCGNKIELADHNYDNDCDTDCNTCDYTRSIAHNYSREWSSDGTNHWHECTVCNSRTDVVAHFGGTATCTAQATCTECNASYGEMLVHDNVEVIDEKYLQSAANCAFKAKYYKSCAVCGMASTEIFEVGEIDATNHTGETEIKDAVKETCSTEGYSGDVYCKGCGEKLEDGEVIPAGHDYGSTYKTDAENHWKECGCGNVIEKETHTLGEWTVMKEATNTEKGSKERVCSVCGYKEAEEISTVVVNSPQTGAGEPLYIWIALLAVSCLCVAGTVVRRKRV